MRIACIAASTIPSRTANSIQVMKVCDALAGLGHPTHLWVPGIHPELDWLRLAAHYGLDSQFEISWLPSAQRLRRYDFSLRAALEARRWGPDLYYVWPLQVAALTSGLGWPTLLEAHDRPSGRLGPLWMGAFLRRSGARRLLTTTKHLRDWLAQRYGLDLKAPFAQVAPNGVDLGRYEALPAPAEARSALGLEQGFTVGYTGHLYSGRGLELMLALARRFTDLRFLWVGGEPAAVSAWQSRLADEQVYNVRLTGFVENARLPLYQAACDVLLMPYERRIAVSGGGDTAEFANPMKAFEYLASGRPILASDLPVMREVLDPELALLLPPQDEAAWADALAAMLDDPARRRSMGEAARTAAQGYSWQARAEKALAGLGPIAA